MKLNLQLALLFICAALLTACKKSNSDGDDSGPKKYISKISFTSPTGTTTIDFTYDDQKRVIMSKKNNELTEYLYNSDGSLFSTEVYSQGAKLTFRIISELRYEGFKITSVPRTMFQNSALTVLTPIGIVYSGDRISEKHQEGTNIFYTYDSRGNIQKVSSDKLTINYTYDDKKNVYTCLPAALRRAGIALTYEEYSNTNNVVSSTSVEGKVTTTYTYTYDSEGYPVSAVVGNTASTNKTTYTYTYIEL